MIGRRTRSQVGLSLRITLTFAFGALAVSAAVAVSAYLFTVRFQVAEQERVALRQAYLNASIVRARLLDQNPDVPSVLDALTTGSSTSTVIFDGGRWFSSSLLISRDALPPDARRATLDGSVVRTWATIAGTPRIVIGIPLPAAESAYFQVSDQGGLRRTLSVLRGILLAAGSATTAAGAALGYWASRRLTAPLRAVARAATDVAGGDLNTRLPEEHDQELSGLVDSFNSMVETLHLRIQRDAAFAADVSHELRSPLTTLSAALSVLVARREELSPRSRDALDLLSAEVDRFEHLVDDLLEISRADARDDLTTAEPLVIGQLVLNVLQQQPWTEIRAQLSSAGMQAVVVGDKRRLRQMIINLLTNAERHAGGATAVTLDADEATVRIMVDDAGPGIPVAERDRIFERFSRGRQGARRGSQGGAGLGLALVKEHVRAHRGRVWVEEAPGGGARFAVELPRMTS